MTGYTESHTGTASSTTYLTYMSKGLPRRLWERTEAPLVREVVMRHGSTPPKVLDLACGNGRAAGALLDVSAEVVGVDYSPDQIAHPVSDRILMARGDASRLGFGDGSFDVVVALRFFSNAENALRVGSLAEVHRVLADDGVAVVNIHNAPRTAPNLARQVVRVLRRKADPRWISRREIEGQFSGAGFAIAQRISYGLAGTLRRRDGLRRALLPFLGYDLYVLAKREGT
jgi:ubiquinone/menaquinone biosynthesis C-methylase UbiE